MKYRLAMTAILSALLVTLFAGNPAEAQVYRCQDGGTTVFSDVPCSDNADLFEMRNGISVVAAADDLDEVAQRNKAFVDQRQEQVAARRARAAEQSRQAARERQRRMVTEEVRYRTIIGPGIAFGSRSDRLAPPDPRVEAQRRRTPARDEPERRRTLLSRSGGNRPNILR